MREEWKRMDAYYEQRGDNYRVSASKDANGWRFEAWRRISGKWQFLAIVDTAAEARAICEAFANEE